MRVFLQKLSFYLCWYYVGIPITSYKKMMAAVESKASDPVKAQTIALLQGYRDPTSFRYTAIVRPRVDSGTPASFRTSK